ncbi:DUF177 domain-containing protein [Altericroceibacterium spongiae]|uniref:DUF177 domain-containing protein n=1 Tax=Altericroceibacterium spongiae TaxID=2320269 RepID=A0A420EJ93_9SPHN|nr:YceD family protein [Altericroceibacterium spongiae]RKF20789.1 DUF177 domain-containing protein [Altericroceibacterium spongiae]
MSVSQQGSPAAGETESGEFSRMIDRRQIGNDPVKLEASEEECAALAERFGLVRVASLAAEVELEPEKDAVMARGRMQASIVQSCAVSGEDLPVGIDEPIAFRFVPDRRITEEELELEEEDCDEIPYSGTAFDLGEAVAQSLALAIDPFLTGPNADKVRQEAGLLDEEAAGPFAALAALKKDQD